MQPRLFLTVVGMALVAGAAQAMTLGEALKRAAERDPFLDAARAVYDAESQLGAQERASLRPAISIDAQGQQSRSDAKFAFGSSKDTFPSWSANVLARQPVLRLDWFARSERADLRDALAKEGLADRHAKFVVRISLRYLDTLLAEDRVRQAQSEARAVRESLNDTRKRYEVELVPGTDLKEAQARDDLSQAQLVSELAGLEDVRDALREVTGYDGAPLPALREPLELPPLVPADAEGWIKLAAEHNAERRIAQMQLDLAKTTLQTRKAEALPVADLVARAGRSDSTEYALGQRVDELAVGVELSVPIYAGGINRARVREAEGRLREAKAEFERVALETDRTMRTLFRGMETARASAAAYHRALESAQLAEKATQAGYDAGTRTISDVLDAKARVVNASRNRNESKLNVLIKLLELNAASGTLTAEGVRQLEPMLFDLS